MLKSELYKKYDPNMLSDELDDLKLTRDEYIVGLVRFLFFSVLGIGVFFGSYNGSTIFSIIYEWILGFFGDYIYLILFGVLTFNFLMHVYVKYLNKGRRTNKLIQMYENDSVLKTALFAFGVVIITIWTIYILVPSAGFDKIQLITGEHTGQSVFPPIVRSVTGVLIVGAVFIPTLINYGALELIGILLEPIMRPLFKIPGKAALDCAASFVGSATLGVIITNRLWKNNVYTNREMVCIMTSFSACSIGYVALVFNTAGVGEYFGILYLLNFLMVYVISFITVRIPPLSKHPDEFYDGRQQTDEERNEGLRYSWEMIPRGINRGIKRAALSRGIFSDIKHSLKDSLVIFPQVLTMLSVVGMIAMVFAHYTPIFDYIGLIFRPYVSLLGIPDVADVAPTMFAGITEMFVPVLMIVKKVGMMSIKSRAFIALVSNAQVIFFSETAIVMLATKSPVNVKELVIAFIERTIIAMPLAALIVHLLF